MDTHKETVNNISTISLINNDLNKMQMDYLLLFPIIKNNFVHNETDQLIDNTNQKIIISNLLNNSNENQKKRSNDYLLESYVKKPKYTNNNMNKLNNSFNGTSNEKKRYCGKHKGYIIDIINENEFIFCDNNNNKNKFIRKKFIYDSLDESLKGVFNYCCNKYITDFVLIKIKNGCECSSSLSNLIKISGHGMIYIQESSLGFFSLKKNN